MARRPLEILEVQDVCWFNSVPVVRALPLIRTENFLRGLFLELVIASMNSRTMSCADFCELPLFVLFR